MNILGINAYHGGASACLIRDGELIAAAEEERFRRIKYWAGFPTQAIRYVLDEGGIGPHDLDHIGISRDPSANLHKKVLFALRRRPNFGFIKDRLNNMARVRDPRAAFGAAFGLGLQTADRALMPNGLKLVIDTSEVLRKLSNVFSPLKYLADSLYVMSVKANSSL